MSYRIRHKVFSEGRQRDTKHRKLQPREDMDAWIPVIHPQAKDNEGFEEARKNSSRE